VTTPGEPDVPEWTTDAATAYGRQLVEGHSVRLRPLRSSDLPLLESWWYDPAINVLNTSHVRGGLPEATFEMFRGWSANTSPAAAGFCVERKDDRLLAGHVSIWGSTPKDRAGTLGVVFGPDFVGHGLGSEAVALMVRYGFLELGLNRVGLQVWAFNNRAISAYRKAGFVEEGRIREAVFHDGRFHDELTMGLLATEWHANQS
jgi:RimJ/RimL family protein N-acetyltransferase